MKVIAFGIAAITVSQVNGQSGNGVTTRYWDCCKPSCAWKDNISNMLSGPVQSCDLTENVIDINTQSGCNGGGAYMCSKQQPQVIDSKTAIGFVAAKVPGLSLKDICCSCYKLTFPSTPALAGKEMIVQITNTGDDLDPGHFDIQIPGGGVGIFNGCTNQFHTGVDGWGDRRGGIHAASECANLPAILQPGCEFRFNWFANADNPPMAYERVACPPKIVELSGCKRADDPAAN